MLLTQNNYMYYVAAAITFFIDNAIYIHIYDEYKMLYFAHVQLWDQWEHTISLKCLLLMAVLLLYKSNTYSAP